jgi:hypothetical protein
MRTLEMTKLAAPKSVNELEARVQDRLSRRVRNLRLDIAEQGVILRGNSRTYYAKQLAQHAVMEATGLRILANEIEVV